MKKKIPEFLKIINRNVKDNIEKHSWAATESKSIADVALLAWLSSVVFNPFRKKMGRAELEKFETLKRYWETKSKLIETYHNSRFPSII